MRFTKHLWLITAAMLAAAALSVPAASANALLPSCGATSHPFTPWSDPDAYCAFPNLGFESGKTGWTLTGNASIVSANEPRHVSGTGTHALQLGPGATALSSQLPVNLLDPWMRAFACVKKSSRSTCQGTSRALQPWIPDRRFAPSGMTNQAKCV